MLPAIQSGYKVWCTIYRQDSTLRAVPYCPGQVEIRVCLPYMTGKISSFNFRDTITQGKTNIFFNSTDKAIAGKQLIGTSIVHAEKSLPCSLFAGQVKILSGRYKLKFTCPTWQVPSKVNVEP